MGGVGGEGRNTQGEASGGCLPITVFLWFLDMHLSDLVPADQKPVFAFIDHVPDMIAIEPDSSHYLLGISDVPQADRGDGVKNKLHHHLVQGESLDEAGDWLLNQPWYPALGHGREHGQHVVDIKGQAQQEPEPAQPEVAKTQVSVPTKRKATEEELPPAKKKRTPAKPTATRKAAEPESGSEEEEEPEEEEEEEEQQQQPAAKKPKKPASKKPSPTGCLMRGDSRMHCVYKSIFFE